MSESKNDKIEQFLKMYSSPNTRKVYKASLHHFFNSVYGEGDLREQSERYFNEVKSRNIQDDIEKFFQSLSNKPPLTIRLRLTALKTFFIENDLEFKEKFWRRIGGRIKGSRALTLDKVPSNEELKQILSHMNIQGKTLFTMLASSGMRIGECLRLNLSDLEDGSPFRIKIRGETTKSGNSRITFISKEAVLLLNEWLKVRQDYLKSACNKITGIHAKYPDKKWKASIKSIEDERVFPFEIQTAYLMWKSVLSKSGYLKKDSSTNRLTVHPHVLRKFFRTRLGAIIPVDVIEAIMGHEAYLSEVYRKYSFEQLGEFYQKGEHALTIFGAGEDVEKINQDIGALWRENKQLKEDNIDLRNQVNEVKNELSEIRKLVDDLDRQRRQGIN